ncbi:DUF6624 domain-containing protein [Neolewinella xylanilytica]|uniref:DUF6624 domain-containing protein n=1 Tax=Neolewinella xylanilytica TaxID=1514080 RepID=UPI0038738FE1
MLTDRVAVNADEPQVYGTQVAEIDPVRKVFRLHPVRDSADLDRRRMELHMMPIARYRRLMESIPSSN